LTKKLSNYEKKVLVGQRKKIKKLQDNLALKYEGLTKMIKGISKKITREKKDLKAEEIQKKEEERFRKKPLTGPIDRINGDKLPAPKLEVLIKQLQKKKRL